MLVVGFDAAGPLGRRRAQRGERSGGAAGAGAQPTRACARKLARLSAFTIFATPAPHRLRTMVRPKARTQRPARATVPRGEV